MSPASTRNRILRSFPEARSAFSSGGRRAAVYQIRGPGAGAAASVLLPEFYRQLRAEHPELVERVVVRMIGPTRSRPEAK